MKKLRPGQKFIAYVYDKSDNGVYACCDELHEYGYYQGDVIFEEDGDVELFDKLGIEEGDQVLLRADPCDPDLYGDDIILMPIKKY